MDHVRGSSLAWPDSLETLRPFIVTWWSGRTIQEMPADVRAVYDRGGFGQQHINLALVVMDKNGEVLRSSIPRVGPSVIRFGPETMGRDFKSQLDTLLSGLELPKVDQSTKPKLTLPEFCGWGQPSGVRIYLTFAANRLNHYRTPIVEAVAMTGEMRKTLQFPIKARAITASELMPWLEQMYPAAIMDGQGGFHSLVGSLQITPAGSDDAYRYAIVQGSVNFELDNRGRSAYQGNLAVVLKYRKTDDGLFSVRGVLETTVPKGPEFIRMTGAIESTPE